jgi:hypothetical protein
MPEFSLRFQQAIARIDAANAADTDVVSDGTSQVPGEVLYSRRMTDWLTKLYPNASEALHLAVRAQHIRRWEKPRSEYPMDRAGYHRWRTALYDFHANTAGQILAEVGYDSETIDQVKSMLRKQRLKADPQTQALEDVICVVFLENYFADFATQHNEEKLINILRRTWAKMSDVGRSAALKLPMSAEASALIGKALAS